MVKSNVKYIMDANLLFIVLMINVNLLILHAQLMKRVVLIYKNVLHIQKKVIVILTKKEINASMMIKNRNVFY